jgi:RNA polymerase sigma-70 factor (ECF subfamily)
MFGMCIRYARTREDAEDILHDGFIAAFRDFHQYKGDGPVEGWVRRVILNTALQFLRKQSKNIFIYREDKELQMSDDSFNDDPFEKEQMIKTMLKSIQDMPTGFRTVLNLYVIEGHSHDQIANLLGISVGTSKSQLFRAKEYLRKVLANALNVNE